MTINVTNKAQAPALSRHDGLVSHILHTEQDAADTDLTVTWVEVEPGGSQKHHSHASEQVYVILSGSGVMTVSGERRDVAAGDLVHIPSEAEHGLENTGTQLLEYVSAATPPISDEAIEEFYEA